MALSIFAAMLRLRANLPREAARLPAAIRFHLTTTLNFNTYVLAAIRLLATIFGFVFWLLAARLVDDPEAVGLATTVVSSATLLAGLSQLGVGYGLVRYLNDAKNPHQMICSAMTTVAAVAPAIAALSLIGLRFWPRNLPRLNPNIFAHTGFVLLVSAIAASLLLHWVFLALRKPVYTLIKHLLQVTIALLFLYVLGIDEAGYLHIVIAFALSVLAGLLVGLAWLLPHAVDGFRIQLFNPRSLGIPFLRFVIPNFLVEQLQRIPDNLITLLVVSLLGPAAGAYFFVAWAMASGMQSLAESAAMSLFAEGSSQPHAINGFAQKALKLGLLLAVFMLVGVILFGKPVLRLYGDSYGSQGYYLLLLLTISIVPGEVIATFASVLRVRERLSMLLIVSGLSFITGTLLAVSGVMIAGLTGAGIGWLSSRILMLIYVIFQWNGMRD